MGGIRKANSYKSPASDILQLTSDVGRQA